MYNGVTTVASGQQRNCAPRDDSKPDSIGRGTSSAGPDQTRVNAAQRAGFSAAAFSASRLRPTSSRTLMPAGRPPISAA